MDRPGNSQVHAEDQSINTPHEATRRQPDVSRSIEMVGLIPAGGLGSRIAPLCCSKEIFPIGFRQVDDGHSLRPKAVCEYLIERMSHASIRKIFLVLRPGKWDIPAYLGDGSTCNVHLAYLVARLPFGAPYTLDQAYPFVRNSLVAIGFPDIIFEPDDAFKILAQRQSATGADLVLGLYPTDRPQITDMVECADDGWVRSFVVKPQHTTLRDTWIIAVWTPVFTQFMHEYLAFCQMRDAAHSVELSVGDIIRVALKKGMKAFAVPFPAHHFVDVGTPSDLARTIRKYALP